MKTEKLSGWQGIPLFKQVLGLILAGGKSSRMGGHNKAYLKYQGVSFIEKNWQLVSQILGEENVWISGLESEKHPFILDENRRENENKGPLEGLRSCLKWIGSKSSNKHAHQYAWILILPIDMIFLTHETLNRLISFAVSQKEAGDLIENAEPQAIYFKNSYLPLMLPWSAKTIQFLNSLDQLEQKNRSFHHLLYTVGAIELQPPGEMEMKNINTPQIYESIKDKSIKNNEVLSEASEVLNFDCGFTKVQKQLRYFRQTQLPDWGETGQEVVSRAKVLCVGLGGLGSPVSLYLAAAGVGMIGIIDPDHVEVSNLQRQILYRTPLPDEQPQKKVFSAKKVLSELNPHIELKTYPEALNLQNVEPLFQEYDVIVDGTDNFETKYLIQDQALKFKKPIVYGSLWQFEGQVSVFWPSLEGPCYRCLFPSPPNFFIGNCAENGVIGALAGIIGSFQAIETLKVVLRADEIKRNVQIPRWKPLVGQLLVVNVKENDFIKTKIPIRDHCRCKVTNI